MQMTHTAISVDEELRINKVGDKISAIIEPMGYKATWRVADAAYTDFCFTDKKRTPQIWLQIANDLLSDEVVGAKCVASMLQDELRTRNTK
jgi:hypothetical protein